MAHAISSQPPTQSRPVAPSNPTLKALETYASRIFFAGNPVLLLVDQDFSQLLAQTIHTIVANAHHIALIIPCQM